jgi:DNA gyrase inhibitor GyrI
LVPTGIVAKIIPTNGCALARDIGSRHDNKAAKFLYEEWLPRSRETPGSFSIFFHYVNVGPNDRAEVNDHRCLFAAEVSPMNFTRQNPTAVALAI